MAVGDLDDEAFVLVAAVLPRAQRAADAVTEDVLRSLGLPGSYPRDARGDEVGYDVCQRAGRQVQKSGLRGVWCRSACTSDGRGRELAWFPATDRSKARAVWRRALPLAAWRYASGWSDLGLVEQPDPTI